MFLAVKSGRRVGLTNFPPSVSQMLENVGAPTSRNPKGVHGGNRDKFTFTSVYTTCFIHTGPSSGNTFLKTLLHSALGQICTSLQLSPILMT
jgi:hypothetical protein